MKIGIITFNNTINYGASLQAYALQESIKSFGCKAEIIDYTNEYIVQKEKNNGKLTFRKIVKKMIMGNGIKRKTVAFQKFEEKNLIFGKELNSNTQLEINEYYNKFITGSDQVWNMDITKEDWNFFLKFVEDDKKKISYAPSFGNVEFPKKDYELAGNYLKKINNLSVREESGKKLIKKICNKDAKVVVDPTLLLNKQEWEDRISFKPKQSHYILVYFPNNKKKVFAFAKKIQKKTGYPIVYLSISPKIQFGIKTIYDASPDEFLGWISNADYVITGSFHGTAFSINLEKQFFYEPSGKGSRIDNIVTLTGTDNRSIENFDEIDKEINYEKVRENLDKLREDSKNWLKKSLMEK